MNIIPKTTQTGWHHSLAMLYNCSICFHNNNLMLYNKEAHFVWWYYREGFANYFMILYVTLWHHDFMIYIISPLVFVPLTITHNIMVYLQWNKLHTFLCVLIFVQPLLFHFEYVQLLFVKLLWGFVEWFKEQFEANSQVWILKHNWSWANILNSRTRTRKHLILMP